MTARQLGLRIAEWLREPAPATVLDDFDRQIRALHEADRRVMDRARERAAVKRDPHRLG